MYLSKFPWRICRKTVISKRNKTKRINVRFVSTEKSHYMNEKHKKYFSFSLCPFCYQAFSSLSQTGSFSFLETSEHGCTVNVLGYSCDSVNPETALVFSWPCPCRMYNTPTPSSFLLIQTVMWGRNRFSHERKIYEECTGCGRRNYEIVVLQIEESRLQYKASSHCWKWRAMLSSSHSQAKLMWLYL